MKKYLFLIFASILLSSPSFSQLDGIGLKWGLNFGTPISKPIEGASATPGLTSLKGVFVRYKIHEFIDLQAEMLVSLKASKFRTPISGDTIVDVFIQGVGYVPFPALYSGIVEGQFRNYYLEVPVVVRVSMWEHWAVLLGGYGAFMLQGNNSGLADIELGIGFDFREDEPFNQTEFLHPWDYGAVIGAEYRRGAFLIDLRATVGLRSIYEKSYAQVENSVWNGYLQGSVGYYFKAKKGM